MHRPELYDSDHGRPVTGVALIPLHQLHQQQYSLSSIPLEDTTGTWLPSEGDQHPERRVSKNQCCVRHDGQQSELFHVTTGVKQGCVISPLLSGHHQFGDEESHQ